MDLFLSKEEKDAALSIAFDNLPQELIDTRGFTNHLKQLMDLLAFRWEFADGAKSRISLFAETLRWSESTVRKYIKHAETLGWLCVERTRTNNLGGQTTNRYWLDWAAIRAPVLNKGAPVLNKGAPVLNEGAPVLNEGPNSYLVSSLSSSLESSLVCVSSDKEEHTQEFISEMQVAVGELCHRLPDSAAVQDAAARLLLDGWTPSDVRQIPLPKFWDDAPTPKQLVEQATLAKAKRVAKERQAESSRSEDSAGRAANKASRQKEAAHRQKKKLLRPQWERLDPADRRRRIQAEKPQLVGMSLAEELAMEVWMKEVNP